MPLQITNEQYNSLPALYANAGKWVSASVSFRNCYRAGSGNSNTFSSGVDNLIIQSGSWLDYGFSDGDTVTIYFKKNGQSVSFSRTIDYINGSYMYFTASLPSQYQYKTFPTSGTYTGMFIVANKQPQSVDMRFNLALTGSTSSDSVIDSELNRFIDNQVGSLAIGIPINMVQLGNKSGGYVKDVVLTRNSDTTFTNAATNGTATEYNYTITFKFLQWGIFQNDQTSPFWYNAANCLNPVIRIASFPQINTSNGQMFDLNGSSNANTGWFNENYNGYPSAYTFTSIELTDTSGNSIDKVAYNQTTHGQAILSAPNQLNGSSNYRLGLAFTPFDDVLYKNLSTDFAQNCLVNAPDVNFQHSASPDATLRSGFENSDGARFDLQNIQFSHSASVLTVDFDIIPSASSEAFFDNLSDGLRNLMMWVQVSNYTTDGTQNSDEVNVLIYNDDCYDAPRIGGQYPDVVDDVLLDHAGNDVTSTAYPNTTTEDNVLYTGTFRLIDDEVVDGVRCGIMCRNISTNDSFMLEEVYFDFTNVPFISGKYEVNETINRGFLLPPSSDRNIIRLTRDTSLDIVGKYGVKLEYGYLNDWRYWFEQANVDDDLFDSNEPFNGKNKNWQKLQSGDWELFVAYFVRVQGVDDYNYTPFIDRAYEDDPNVSCTVTYTDSNGNTINALPNTGIVDVEAVFDWINAFADEWAEVTCETFEGTRIGFISSVLDHDGQPNNCLLPSPGQTKLQKTLGATSLTVNFRIDCSQIGSNSVSLSYRSFSTPKVAIGYLITTNKDAELAYSFRRVSSKTIYPDSLPVVRLIREVDDVEQDFFFVGDAVDDIAIRTFASGSNVLVKTWYDQTGNGRHAVQTDKTKMAKVANPGSVLKLNGKVCALFDGVNDAYEITGTTSTSPTYYITGVIERTAGTETVLIGSLTNTYYPIRWSSFNVLITNMAVSGNAASSSALTGQTIITAGRDASLSIYVQADGTFLDSDTSSADPLVTLDYFGVTDTIYLSGNFQEVVYWRKDKTSALTTIETNINDYYSAF